MRIGALSLAAKLRLLTTGAVLLTTLSVLDTLKMHRSLVRGVDVDPDSAAITAAVAAMARGLEVEPLAEGVETLGQREVLRRQGFQRMQGYLFGKPLPAAELMALELPVDRSKP